MTVKLVEYITEITNIYFTLYDKNVKYTSIFFQAHDCAWVIIERNKTAGLE